MKKKSLQQGFNLLELMLALLVVAAITFTSIRYFFTANQQARVTQAVSQIDTLVKASYEWVQGKDNFSGITVKDLVAAGYLPSSFEQTVNNPWKGSIEIRASSSDLHRLLITLSNVPYNACGGLMEKLQQQVAVKDGKPIITDCPTKDTTFWGVF